MEIMRKHRSTRRERKTRLTLIQMTCQAGMTPAEISAVLGIPAAQLSYHLRNEGYELAFSRVPTLEAISPETTAAALQAIEQFGNSRNAACQAEPLDAPQLEQLSRLLREGSSWEGAAADLQMEVLTLTCRALAAGYTCHYRRRYRLEAREVIQLPAGADAAPAVPS